MVFKKSSMILGSLMFALAFLALVVPGALAADFSVERENIDYRISPDEVAKYNLTIDNYLDVEQRFTFGLSLGDSLKWIVYPSTVRVPASESKTFVVSIAPKSTTSIGVYQINMLVKSGSEEQTIDLPVDLSFDGMYYGFTPNIETEISLPESIDPRKSTTVGVTVKNRNPLNIENAELRIRSELFSDDQLINISPGPHWSTQEIVSKELVFSMDPLQKPGEYDVTVQIYYPAMDEIISSNTQTVSVMGYSSTPSKLETSRKLFVVENEITVENFGNRKAVAEVKLSAGWLKRMFSVSSHDMSVEDVDGESSFVWTPTLEPTEKQVIIVRTNYWPLVIGLLIILIAIISYFVLRSPVIIEKEVAVIDEDVGEGSSDLRVRLFVKNRSGSSVYNLTVSDKVRGITDYVESSQLGHVKPSRTTKTSKKGTMLYWDIEELEAYEERIFTYKLKSKLKVVGDLTLPRARAKFESKNNKERKILSGKPFFRKLNKKVNE